MTELSSNKKIAKKARQYYRRDVQRGAREWAAQIGNAMKPKPKWIPMKLWLKGAGIFIKINKSKK